LLVIWDLQFGIFARQTSTTRCRYRRLLAPKSFSRLRLKKSGTCSSSWQSFFSGLLLLPLPTATGIYYDEAFAKRSTIFCRCSIPKRLYYSTKWDFGHAPRMTIPGSNLWRADIPPEPQNRRPVRQSSSYTGTSIAGSYSRTYANLPSVRRQVRMSCGNEGVCNRSVP
jgi:hypothetical protein